MFNLFRRIKNHAPSFDDSLQSNEPPEFIAWINGTQAIRNAICNFLELPINTCDKKKKTFLIVLIPWLGTPVPWYALITGLFLRARGHDIICVLDDYLTKDNDTSFIEFQNKCIRSILSLISSKVRSYNLNDLPPSRSNNSDEIAPIKFLSELNAIWEYKGEMDAPGKDAFITSLTSQLKDRIPKINTALNLEKFNAIVLPGGIWGSSGVWLNLANARNIRVVTYDSGGYGSTMLSVNGVACQLADIPEAFHKIKKDTLVENQIGKIADLVKDEINKRKSGTDKFSSQIRNSDSHNLISYKSGTLIALNSAWDSAALGMHEIYSGSTEWMVQTIHILLEKTTTPIIIRQHPAERFGSGAFMTNEDYQTILFDNFGDNKRILFIAAADPINSYKLLDVINLVVAHTSTVALEAAIHGIPVVTTSKAYWSKLGFVYKASSITSYEDLLQKGASGNLKITSEMKKDAELCYYLAQCCNWIYTPFNVEGFDEYIQRTLQEIYGLETVQLMLDSIIDNIPFAYLKHQSIIKL